MLADKLLDHRYRKIPLTPNADLISEEVPFQDHGDLESCLTFFQEQLKVFKSLGEEEEEKEQMTVRRKFSLVS